MQEDDASGTSIDSVESKSVRSQECESLVTMYLPLISKLRTVHSNSWEGEAQVLDPLHGSQNQQLLYISDCYETNARECLEDVDDHDGCMRKTSAETWDGTPWIRGR